MSLFFDLGSSQDLLGKCEHDYNRLSLCGGSRPEQSYTLFSLLLSLNHLLDWVLNDEENPIDRKLQCIREFNPYRPNEKVSQDYVSYFETIEGRPLTNIQQRMVRLFSNRLKHLNLSTVRPEKAINIFSGGRKLDIVFFTAEIDGRWIELTAECAFLIDQWRQFHGFEAKYCLEGELPARFEDKSSSKSAL